ncbi:MAG: tetratricopeptide repeat protein, partial [Chthoniobacteraceae bacterium]
MMHYLKKHFPLVAILSLIAATFAIYWPSLQNQFVWDDTALILRDPFIRSWQLIPEGFRHFLFTDATASDFYRPIQRLTYTFDYALYAFQPWGYHFTNIILHAATAIALFLCASRLLAKSNKLTPRTGDFLAWLAAFAWTVHPVHSEAVMYVASRADLLAALFGFAGLFFAIGADGKNSRVQDWLAALCFLLAMLSKESGVTALIIWLAATLYFFDKVTFRRWLVVAAAIVAIYCGLRFSAEKIAPPESTPTSLAARPILMARAWAEYAGLLLAPVNLHMERSVVTIDHGDPIKTLRDATMRTFEELAGVALIIAFIFWLVWVRNRLPVACFLLVAFLIAYLPVSDLFSLNATVAEHWLYFSSGFLFIGAALSLHASPLRGKLLLGVLACWVGLLGARTFVRNADWKDQRTFLMATTMDGGNTPRMMINLGALESSEGRQNTAIAYYQNALTENPDQPFALLGLASAYQRAHDYENARATLQRARIIPLVHAEALERIAVLEYLEHKTVRLDLLQKAAQLEPGNWEIQST